MSAPFVNAHTHSLLNDSDTEFLYNLSLDSSEKSPYVSAGIHPADIQKFSIENLECILAHVHCSAIGECGLDSLLKISMETQELLFHQQIMLAEQMKLPMVIHSVRCHDKILHFRKKEWHSPDIPWLIHGFRGKKELACDFIHAGCLLSLSPVWVQHLQSWPDWLPYGSFLLETDEAPIAIYEMYKKTASLKLEPVEKVREELYKTYHRFLSPVL